MFVFADSQVVSARMPVLAASWPLQVVRFACRRHDLSRQFERLPWHPLGGMSIAVHPFCVLSNFRFSLLPSNLISKPSLSCTELHRLVHSHRLNRKVPSIAVLHRPVIQLVVLCSVASTCQALCSLCSLICTGLDRPTMLVKYLQIYHAGHYLQIYEAHTQ